MAAAAAALFGALSAAQGVRPVLVKTPPSPLAPLAPGEQVSLPTWLPADAVFEGAVGRTNVLSLEARWLFGPVPGRPAFAWLCYSNRTAHAYVFERARGDYRDRRGVLPLAGFPECAAMRSPAVHFEAGEWFDARVRLPAEFAAAAAGAAGLVLAYIDHEEPYVFWAESAAIPPPATSSAPGTAGTNEWAQLVGSWSTNGMPYGVGGPEPILADYPEFAPFFPGVVLDASLPEAFRIEFAKRMPRVAGYDPRVLQFIQDAQDKDAPLVLAAMRALKRNIGATPEESAARRAAGGTLWGMSLQTGTYPVRFRMHAAHLFRVVIPRDDIAQRPEPTFKLLAADDFRQAFGRDFPPALRSDIRDALTAMEGLTDVFEQGPLEGKYPEGATIEQVAAIILADLEAKWAAEPYEER
jgi:hypothetical protein